MIVLIISVCTNYWKDFLDFDDTQATSYKLQLITFSHFTVLLLDTQAYFDHRRVHVFR